jgi:two-component system chemotaxis family response regulator WspR
MTILPPSEEYGAMVLLVDDQAIVGEALRRALADEAGIDFHYCRDPADAIRVAEAVQPTVILQDLVMPDVDGLDLVRRYRQDPVTSRVPIIVLSTKEDASIKREAFSAGANDYLVKLPDRIELVARIRYHSHAFQTQLQRDQAYRALRESQQQLMLANLELQRLILADGLTGLSNRRHCDEYLTAEWEHSLRRQSPLSVLMIDVDDFKKYNDHYGHLAGDEVLRQVANTIRANCLRTTDLAARFGGEEFIMVLDTPSLTYAEEVATKLCRDVQALQLEHEGSSTSTFVTVSVGGAMAIPREGYNPADLVHAADEALYEAKRMGKNQALVKCAPWFDILNEIWKM